MTTSTAAPVPDATRCPDCRSPLTDRGRCPACGLALTGPDAGRLWEVDVALRRLQHAHEELLIERSDLLGALRRQDSASAGAPATPAPPVQRSQEWTSQRVQNLLLTLGGLLLAGAALVFTAVTYDRLGATGRAVVLATLTLAAGAAAPRLHARGLRATAEAVAGVALVLAALDAYGLRTLGLADDSDPLLYAAGSTAALAACAGAYAAIVPLRAAQLAWGLLAQLPVPLLLARTDAPEAAIGLALAGQAAVDLAVWTAFRGRLPADADAALSGSAAVLTVVALAEAVLGASTTTTPGLSAVALVACAALLAGASLLAAEPLRRLLAGTVVPLLAGAACTLAWPELGAPLAVAAVGLLAALAAARLPGHWRVGPSAGALTTAAVAVLLVGEAVLSGVVLPLAWPADPWELAPGADARDALGPGQVWMGSAVTPVVLIAAAGTCLAAGLALHRRLLGAAGAWVLGTAAVVLLPLGLDLPYGVGLGLLLACAAALAVGGAALAGRGVPRRAETAFAGRGVTGRAGTGLAAAGLAVALHAVAWSTAAPPSTLRILPLAALVAAGLATSRLPLLAVPGALAGVLAAAELAAVGAAADLAGDQIGALLVVAVAVLLAAAVSLDGSRRTGADAAAATVAAAALVLTSGAVGWLSWTLLGLGLLALATALRPDRRPVAALGGLLLAAASWVRLFDADVTAPEPYVLPAAAVALVLGRLRRHAVPGTPSWAAYAPGLSLALLPSLIASFGNEDLTRALLLGLAALGVLLVGAASRLQAPLVLGGAVLLVDALHLLLPYASALPRWLSLGAIGALLVLVGATYEQRRRDVTRLRDSYEALA